VGIYNGLVGLRNQVKEAWAQVDVQLKRRFDLIPNLMETVKGYMSHERETLEAVTNARNEAAAMLKAVHDAGAGGAEIKQLAGAESALQGALGRLNVTMEAYPDLKANQNFLQLQDTLDKIEGEVQMSRRYYNGAARDLNVKVESFPSNFVANYFKFDKAEYFEIENASDREVPQVKF